MKLRFIIFLSLLSCLSILAQDEQKVLYTPEQESFFNIVSSRRSVRRFLTTPIPDEHITKIIEMAHFAPSSGNQQGWKFLVIKRRENINKLKDACAKRYLEYYNKDNKMTEKEIEETKIKINETLSGYLSAPVIIVVLTDTLSIYPTYNVFDGCLAAENILLAARALGYGSVFTTDSFPFDIVRDVFSIPGNYKITTVIPIGIPVKWPDTPRKKSIDDLIVYEKFESNK